jgi:hypothetical protein
MNALEIPGPARRVMIEAEQAPLGERVKKLNHEEWIARGLLMHQLGQRRGAFPLAVKGIRDQVPYVLTTQRCQRDFIDLGTTAPDGLKLARQRMRGIDLVVPVGADQHQVLQVRLE